MLGIEGTSPREHVYLMRQFDRNRANAAFVVVLEPVLANLACRRGDLALLDAPAQAYTAYQQATELDPGCDLQPG